MTVFVRSLLRPVDLSGIAERQSNLPEWIGPSMTEQILEDLEWAKIPVRSAPAHLLDVDDSAWGLSKQHIQRRLAPKTPWDDRPPALPDTPMPEGLSLSWRWVNLGTIQAWSLEVYSGKGRRYPFPKEGQPRARRLSCSACGITLRAAESLLLGWPHPVLMHTLEPEELREEESLESEWNHPGWQEILPGYPFRNSRSVKSILSRCWMCEARLTSAVEFWEAPRAERLTTSSSKLGFFDSKLRRSRRQSLSAWKRKMLATGHSM
jgi:hypothetical protein